MISRFVIKKDDKRYEYGISDKYPWVMIDSPEWKMEFVEKEKFIKLLEGALNELKEN